MAGQACLKCPAPKCASAANTCAGTIEDRVDCILERKRDLASKVVAAGQHWITEIANEELRELFTLAEDASLDEEDDDYDSESSPPPPMLPGGRKSLGSDWCRR